MPYIIIGIVVLVACLSGALWIQTARLDVVTADYAAFAAKIEVEGKLAIKDKEIKENEFSRLKALADSDNLARRADIISLVKRLHDAEGSSSSILPKDTRETGDTSQLFLCFDRDKLDRAQSESEVEAEAIAIRGAEALVDLQTAHKWSCELK